jgi:hypothetical protein
VTRHTLAGPQAALDFTDTEHAPPAMDGTTQTTIYDALTEGA